MRRSWVRAGRDGFVLDLPDGLRDLLPRLGEEVAELLGTHDDVVQRVFPTAYPDDADREAGYQALVRDELVERHRAGLDLIAATVAADSLTHEELTRWMTTVNAMRLVLGTALGIDDDDHDLELPPEHPQALTLDVFRVLGVLLDDILDALGA